MITIVDGDLLDSTEDIIAHSVNCQGKMNSGVAKAIREKYPKAYDDYIKMYIDELNDGISLLGKCQIVEVGYKKYVANLFGQEFYGYDGSKYTNEARLKQALTILKNMAMTNNLSVALPYKIGCDRGGGDWDEVYGIINEVFSDYEVTLYKLNL